MLSHIVAASENNIIGKDNGLPWHLPKDFNYFKNKTWCMPIIMGRNTYESMKTELPGRMNVVITSKTNWHPKNIEVVHTIDDAINKAKEADTKEIFIIGGGDIFKQTLDKVDRVYLTRVHTHIEGDTYYPELNKSEWKLTSSIDNEKDEKNNYPFTFEIWDRIENAE